tara:strand:+ start:791 stop:1066 length:276 start_codon:yes stop_codon:yes gene_type:complete
MAIDIDKSNEIMQQTMDNIHGQNIIIYAHVIQRPVEGVPNEVEYYHSMMMDRQRDESVILGGSPTFDNYDDCLIDMNNKLAEWIGKRYDDD